RKIRIYTIGVGTPGGAPVPNPLAHLRGQPDYLMQNGEIYLTKLDAELLSGIATKTGGKFFLATDEEGLRGAYAEIDRLEKHEIEVSATRRYTEIFPWLAIPALMLLTLEVGLSATRYRSFL
ncbi:MAG: aerotolerance regulator BatA, partial [bacterium]